MRTLGVPYPDNRVEGLENSILFYTYSLLYDPSQIPYLAHACVKGVLSVLMSYVPA